MKKEIVVLAAKEGLGQIPAEQKEFGIELFDRYLHALESQPVKPIVICFYTEGVKLLAEGSRVILSLRLLQGMGVRIVACRTCVEKFGIADKLAVGEMVTMSDIVSMMHQADSVITI
jgi:intracellular sulfur oxidation DsrE/DsrF family protein